MTDIFNNDLKKINICKKPIFVVGCPRSGTSVTSWSLAKHSKTWLSAESDFFVKIINMGEEAYEFGTKRGYHHWLSRQEVSIEEFYKHLGKGINSLYTNRSKGKRWIEQTPLYSLHLPRIKMLFPKAQYIHIVRNGRDTVNSMINSGFKTKWAKNFRLACKTYKKYLTKLDEFKKNNPEKIKRIYLEKVKKNPEKELRKACEFLNLKFEKKVTKLFEKNEKMNSSYKTEEERKKKDWKKTWTKKQKKTFNNICSDIMKKYGY